MNEMILEGLKKGSKGKKPKHLKEFHAKEQHDGSYHVTRHSGKPGDTAIEHGAQDLDQVHDAMEEHLGGPNEGEEEATAAPALGAGEPGMGGETA